MGFLRLVLITGLALFVTWTLYSLELRQQYLDAGLAPFGSQSAIKDLAAFAMTSMPRLVRTLKTGSNSFDLRGDIERQASLEGFHTTFQFSPLPNKICESKYFAENYYFWASDSTGATDFLLTTRLSFYGKNASRVIPWFTFQIEAEEWNLPQAFEPEKHLLESQDRVALDVNGLGRLEFINVTPMREWRLEYEGTVENRDRSKTRRVRAVFTLLFSEEDVYSYQVHWDEMATALALAGKPWDADFFKNLRAQNQERYASKTRSASGYIQFLDESTEPQRRIELPTLQASRDHLWGIRNWVFMPRYIWWPPIALKQALEIEGVRYTGFIGAFVEYGNTMENMVVGGLISDEGKVAAFSGATHMRDIAPEWYAEPPKREFIGERLVPGDLQLDIGLLNAAYVMRVEVERGAKHGLWSHTFSLAEGDFEIHEALSRFKFTVYRSGNKDKIVAQSSAMGLFEFGATVVPVTVYEG